MIERKRSKKSANRNLQVPRVRKDFFVRESITRYTSTPEGYAQFLHELKERVVKSQLKAALAANSELISLYWDIGKAVVERQKRMQWGDRVLELLSHDLAVSFPDIKGFSRRNLYRMRAFYLTYRNSEIVPQLVAQIPWGHNVVLLEKVKDPAEREWYVRKSIEHGWSRPVLVHQIESGLYRRQGKAVNNFDRTLPPTQSDLAKQVLKDPYVFDFLSLGEEAEERDLEQGLIEHIRKFLLELGVGFSFVGSQYHLEVGDQDFYLDMLFYHLRLRCFVVIDLKMGAFQPEYAGKMNFYLSAVDDLLRHKDDHPSIGIILCKSKNKIIVEYALRDTRKPIGVSGYKLTESLPKKLQGKLPTIEALERELGKEGDG